MFKILKRLLITVPVLTVFAVGANGTLSSDAGATVTHRPFANAGNGLVSHLVHGATTSTNWSGYATRNSTFTNVTGSWTQPAVSCPSHQTQAASFWVGLDGLKSSTVEQIGTDSDCVNGKAQYYAWYELYPAASNELQSARFPVSPGDSFTASVVSSSGRFTLTLSDNGARHKWTFTTTHVNPGATNSSAEWVAEAPSLCTYTCNVLPLPNFGSVHFTGSLATAHGVTGSISSFTNSSITMVSDSGAQEAVPSGLSDNGTAFAVTYVPPVTSGVPRHHGWAAN